MHRPRLGLFCAAALAATTLAAAPAPAPPAPDPLARFYRQHLEWARCAEPGPREMRCATLTVPIDYADPGKGTVGLVVARIPATGPRKGALVLNFGGPGGPGVATLAAAAHRFGDLGEGYDLVTFDPRGVAQSAPVSCGGALDEAGTGDSDAARVESLRTAARECARNSGPVLPYVGTVNVARDMDVLRQALGERRLNYLGFSYGTRLGAVYAAEFPKRTGRMVLDGVDTLSEPLVQQALVSAQGQQEALDNFLTWCTRQRGCVYGTNARTAKEKLPALVDRLNAEPLIGPAGYAFTGQDVVNGIGFALYSRRNWPRLADALGRIESERDPGGMLELGGLFGPEPDPEPDASASPAPGEKVVGTTDVPWDNSTAALIAVSCADAPDRIGGGDPARVVEEIDGLQAEFLEASRLFGPSQLLSVLSCYGRPAGTDFIRKIDRPGAPRMLLVGTRGDPATPYRWTEETAKRLGNAVVLDYKGEGHGGYDASPCVRAHVDAYLLDGSLPRGTASCTADE